MGEATIQVENWAPPSLNSLDFSTNCSLAREFFRTWFDFSTDRLIEVPEAWESNATFWIPSSIDEVATERFFRAALLPGVKGVPSFGDILDWEYQLRHEYSIELNNSISRGDETSFDPLYFATVIDSPAHGCKDMTCNLGIQADQLADLNGPGIHIFLWFQTIVLCVYALIVAIESSKILDSPRRPRMSRALSSVKDAFTGFADTISVFNLAFPVALIVHYYVGDGETNAFRKDLLLAAWLAACSFNSSLLAYRIGACLRRISNRTIQPHGPRSHAVPPNTGTPPSHGKPTLIWGTMTLFGLGMLVLAGVLLLKIAIGDTSSSFEHYSDSICDFQYSLSRSNLIVTLACLIGYCVVRLAIFALVGCCMRMRYKKKAKRAEQQWPSVPKDHRRMARQREAVKFIRSQPSYRRVANFFGVCDVLVLALAASVLLCFYERYRVQLLHTLHLNWFVDGWTLGQVLSISACLPVVFDFLRCYRESKHTQQ